MPSAPKPSPRLLRLDRARGLDEAAATSLEWFETDGLGGYASSTVAACATRRYHGLLVGRPPKSAKRHVFLARYDERIRIDGEELAALSMAAYGATYAPAGVHALESFEQVPYPRFVYRVGPCRLIKEVLQVHGSPTVLVRYRLDGDLPGAVLELRPLVPMREADSLTFANDALDPTATAIDGGFSVQPYEALPTLSVTTQHPAADFEADPVWYEGMTYAADEARGYPSVEDQFSPGALRIPLDRDVVVAATVAAPPKNPSTAWRKEDKRRRVRADELLQETTPLLARTQLAADDFLYRAPGGRLGVTAGLPWFGEWGRDTFLALPGLTIARGDLEACADGLSGALEYLSDGLLPNVFGTSRSDSAYNSADASLWFARAVQLWDAAGGDEDRLFDEYLPALTEIADCYREGTGLDIAADDDQLLHVGSPAHNPTWMDAQTSTGPVTPRDGFPVEVNALWYALLAHLEELCDRKSKKKAKRQWTARRRKAKRAFMERFWVEDGEYLADVWKDGTADRSVRPNMVIAAALGASPLTRKQRAGVVARAEAELLTESGLRTLSPASPDYVGRYEGGPEERDRAYHQGTVWPWLIGFYGEARLRATSGSKREVLADLRVRLAAFERLLDVDGLGHVSEVFDGDPPRRGGGTPAQAWNTAELLRLADMIERGRP